MNVDEVKESLKRKSKQSFKNSDLLSTGSTLLNCAISGKAKGGFIKGNYFLLVGGSSSGKTFLSLTCFAEAACNPNFDDYRFIFNNGENGALMSIEKFFGSKVAERIEMVASETIEDLYDDLFAKFNEGRPLIYVMDSMDVLTSESEEKKASQQRNARQKGKESAGSFGDGKAKINSTNIRRVLHKLRKTGSILILISQTRDNIGFGSQFEPKTRSGGRALTFYACCELWSSIREHIKKEVKGKKRELGIQSKVVVKKNRLTGRNRAVYVPIYHSFGIDDIGSCVDYLIEERHWKKSGSKITAPEFEFAGQREALIHHIEEEGEEGVLQKLVQRVWNEIEEACQLQRKPRYE